MPMKRLFTLLVALLWVGVLGAQVLTSVPTQPTHQQKKGQINPKDQVSINTFYKGDAKNIIDYSFSYTDGTFESIHATGTPITPDSWDDGNFDLDLTGTFSFNYNGTQHSVFSVNTNGTLKFGSGYVSLSNDLASNTYYPLVAPLWDDLRFYESGSNDGLFYKIDSLPTDTVLTIEWYNVCRYGHQGDSVSFQVKLYKNSGLIEVVYGDMSRAANWDNASVSIGINDNENGVTNFISVTPGTPPTASYTVANNSIDGATLAAIPEGRTYQFNPPVPLNHDIKVIALLPLGSLTGDIDLQAVIKNRGENDETGVPLNITMNDGTNDVYTNSVSVDIASGLTDTVSLGTWTVTTSGLYTATLFSDLPTDEDHTNDTLVRNFVVADAIDTMTNGADTVCYALFYDSGGPDGGYQNSENYTFTFYANDPSKWLQVDFSYYDIENNWDKLYIYKGTTADDNNLITIITGGGSNVNIKGKNNAITFKFTSDGSVTKNGWEAVVSCYNPPAHEMGILAVNPTGYIANTPFNPVVTLQNNAINDENNYSLEYTNKDGSYAGNQSYTTVVPAGGTAQVELPSWTASAGNDTLTVILHLAADEDATNDTLVVPMSFINADAVAGHTSDGTYEFFNTATGNSMPYATIGTSPFPMAEDFDGTNIYRIYYDWSFAKVNPTTGQETILGTISGSDGIPTGIAWNWNNDSLYVMSLEGSSNNVCHLYRLDLNTLTLVSVGVASTNAMIIGIDFGAQDTMLYGPAIDNENFYAINPHTGEMTLIGGTGLDLNYGQDVSYDYEKDTFYTVAYDQANSNPARFGWYDLTSGAFTEIQPKSGQYATFASLSTPYELYTVTFNVTDGTDPVANAVIKVANRTLTTDVNGQASLNLGNGDYTALTTAFGYFDNSTDFTVADADMTVDITLTERPQYTISFNVHNILNNPLENTAVSVSYLDSVYSSGNTDATGLYITDPLYQGYPFICTFVKDGYNTLVDTFAIYSDTTVDVTLIETMVTPYALAAEQQNFDADVLFSWNNFQPITEDFEAGALSEGWSTQQTCTDQSGPIPGYWTVNDYSNSDIQPYGTYSAGLWWSYNHQDERLITPAFNCVANTHLTFYTYVFEGSQHGDHYYVEVSTDDGNTWTPVWDASALTGNAWHTFQDAPYDIDLSDYAGQNIKIAFHAIDGDGGGLWYVWFVDNISIDLNGKLLKFNGSDLIASTSYRVNKNAQTSVSIARDGMSYPHINNPRVLQHYKVFLNGTLAADNITDSSYLFQDLTPGLYRFGVLGVYETGESDTAFLDFLVRGQRTITFNVTNAIDNSPIEGANITMTCDCDSSYTATTGADGTATLNEVLDGNYTIDVTATGYEAYNDTAVINSDRTFDIQLQPLFTVNITVLDSATQAPLGGANITMSDGTHTYNLTTGSNGQASQSDVYYGTYNVSISKPGYHSLDTILEVNDNIDVTYYLSQIPTEVVSDNYRIYPNPTSGLLNIHAKADYTVEIINANGQVVYTTNINTGNNSIDISNLPAGVYMMRMTSDSEQLNVKIIKN